MKIKFIKAILDYGYIKITKFIQNISTYIKTHRYDEIQVLKVLGFVSMILLTNLSILVLSGVYTFQMVDILYVIFSIILITITISLPEKFIGKKYHIYVDLNGRINWLYSEVITFGLSLLLIPVAIPIIKSARYARYRRKLLALRKGEILNRERSEIFLFNSLILLTVAFLFILLFNLYHFPVYAESGVFLFSYVLINLIPYRYFDGVIIFYHNKYAYTLMILMLILILLLLPFNYITSFTIFIAFTLLLMFLLYIKLF